MISVSEHSSSQIQVVSVVNQVLEQHSSDLSSNKVKLFVKFHMDNTKMSEHV